MAPNMSDKGRSPISAERWICFSASVTKVCVLHPDRIRTMDPTGYCLFLLTITLPIEFIFQLYIYKRNTMTQASMNGRNLKTHNDASVKERPQNL